MFIVQTFKFIHKDISQDPGSGADSEFLSVDCASVNALRVRFMIPSIIPVFGNLKLIHVDPFNP